MKDVKAEFKVLKMWSSFLCFHSPCRWYSCYNCKEEVIGHLTTKPSQKMMLIQRSKVLKAVLKALVLFLFVSFSSHLQFRKPTSISCLSLGNRILQAVGSSRSVYTDHILVKACNDWGRIININDQVLSRALCSRENSWLLLRQSNQIQMTIISSLNTDILLQEFIISNISNFDVLVLLVYFSFSHLNCSLRSSYYLTISQFPSLFRHTILLQVLESNAWTWTVVAAINHNHKYDADDSDVSNR